jgi:hypothetical protein
MQRNQAASDAEARTRVRGFLLEGAKNAVIANMSKYESALASAQGQQAIAKIDEELAKNLVDIYKHSDQNALSLRNQAIEKWKTKLQMSMESWANSISAKNAETNRMNAKKGDDPWANYLPDVSSSGQGKLRYQIMRGRPEKKDEITERLGHIANFDNQVAEFQNLIRKVGTIPTEHIPQFLQSPEGAQLLALRDGMAFNLAYAKSGKQVNKEEFEHQKKQMPLETWLTQGDREKIVAQTQKQERESAFAEIAPFVREVGQDETVMMPGGKVVRLRDIDMSPHFNGPGQVPSGIPSEASAFEDKNILNPPPLTPAEKARASALELLDPKSGRQIYDGDNAEVEKAHKGALKFDPSMFGNEVETEVKVAGAPSMGKFKVDRPVYKYEKGLVELRRLARDHDDSAMQQLIHMAQPYLANLPGKDDESAFAAYMLSTLDEPEETGKDYYSTSWYEGNAD